MTDESVSFLKLNPEKFDNSAFYAASEQKCELFTLVAKSIRLRWKITNFYKRLENKNKLPFG